MTEQKKREIIGEISLFQGLPDDQLETIAALAREKQYGRGETIFFEGDPGNGFYLIAAGQVKVFKMNLLGKEHILHIFGPGEPIGEVAVFHGQPFPASAEALVQSTLLFLPRREFVELIEAHPSIALNMLAVLSLRLRQFTAQIENLSLKEVPARLASYLLVAAEEQQTGNVVNLDISKGQLASLLGTIPETLSRIFARMSDDGLIRVDGRAITILDRQALADR
ncbi:Crp/Fnr family transcriptional regulator [Desulfofustis glycolicus]|uniref:Transcriptional regulator, Crp/Fnr family n=1 Tax=Desulfofustis glycolicus DSM 9705 TaxID=1121409 RepID=A0A1M5Y8U2_9BACT|nr:Crp/Fnr family transcriptional regulator [Desulfofustis glycolicus]MCB2218367.1 Crp/Fnr family transcriptional regulator [Desulfobulbaceae bacterium]SHI08481.1 transcriptional regulator, Crp/Fnr family [Desulfofustis glycolicus DSM 9705]